MTIICTSLSKKEEHKTDGN